MEKRAQVYYLCFKVIIIFIPHYFELRFFKIEQLVIVLVQLVLTQLHQRNNILPFLPPHPMFFLVSFHLDPPQCVFWITLNHKIYPIGLGNSNFDFFKYNLNQLGIKLIYIYHKYRIKNLSCLEMLSLCSFSIIFLI